ncbi:hypothetical protein BD413DRAFT_489565 [Trametes elegans]|nr:hypothetical protein BD413DRAFT_489565 [Trametes elegans]
MRFFKALPAIGMVIFGAASVLAQDAQLLIQGIKEITAASADLRDIVGNVTATNVYTQGPKVIDGFEDIVSSIKDIIAAITVPNPTPFPAATPTVARRAALQSVADEVAAVFLEFIRIHQNLLAVVIGKHGIFARTPFLAPLAAILRVLESVVDTLGTAVILLIPTVADTVQGPFNDLLKTLAEAVRVYS